MSQKIKTSVEIDGSLSASQIANATTDTDKFLVSDGGTVKYRTGLEVLSDLGISFGTASKIQHQVKAGVAINKGQAVYVTGADGTNMVVGLASNASEGTSSKTMGLLNNTVAINGFADVITEGLLAGLNTIGATVGDPVWLGTGGNLIYGLVSKPYAPNHLVFIGIVTRVNANNGEIFVKVQNGFELEELHNVLLSNLQNKQLLTYNTSNGLWENKSISTVLGGTSDQYVKGDGSFSSAMNSRIEVNFVATAGQTTFNTPYEVGQVDVYYNGSKLYPNEFTATDRYSIVLAVGASLNAQISIVKYVSTFSTTAIRNEAIFTTTSGQTTFSVNYAVGQVDVFYNGSKLNTSEFTATDGTSVVLGFACASGESIAIISYVNQVSGAVGTANKVAKFTGTATLGDSSISDNGTVVSLTNSDSRLYGGDNVGRFIIGNPTVNTYLAIYGSSHSTLPNFAQIIVNNSQAISMYSSGNVFIGSSPVDNGNKLMVNGIISSGISSSIQGQITLYSTTALAEGNIYGRTGGGMLFNTNSNSYPIEFGGSKIQINPSVGIGTGSNVNSKLHVDGQDIYLTGNTDNRIRFSNYGFTGNSMGAAIGYVYAVANTQEQGNLAFYTNPNFNGTGSLTERVRITAAGLMGIGTISPESNLEIYRASSGDAIILSAPNDTGYSNYIAWNHSKTKSLISARIGTLDDGAYGGHIVFQNRTGLGTTTTERARITTSGFTKMSNTGSYYGSGTYHEFNSNVSLNDTLIINHSGATPYGMWYRFTSSPNNASSYFAVGSDGTETKFFIFSNGSMTNRTGSYGTISDIKYKENITDATSKLEDIMQLKVRNFNFIGNESKQIGFIAQEFEDVFPGMVDVSTEKAEEGIEPETYKSIKTSVLTPILVKAMQELAEQVKELKAEIEILKNK